MRPPANSLFLHVTLQGEATGKTAELGRDFFSSRFLTSRGVKGERIQQSGTQERKDSPVLVLALPRAGGDADKTSSKEPRKEPGSWAPNSYVAGPVWDLRRLVANGGRSTRFLSSSSYPNSRARFRDAAR